MDSTLVIYTGLPLASISVSPNQDLETILGSINTAVNGVSGAPSYTSYNLQCLRPTYTINTTQQFAESVADFICELRSDFETFTDTTYVNDLEGVQDALDALNNPELTYSPFSITDADDLATVYSKIFAGISGMITKQNNSSANWSTLSLTPAGTTMNDGFNSLIAYIANLASTVSGKQASIGTFNNSANCLEGTATDSVATTINKLTDLICTLPKFDASQIDWGCMSEPTVLMDGITNIIDFVTSISENYVVSGQNGVRLGANAGNCAGYYAEIDTDFVGLYKVAIDNTDAANGDGDYLENKIISSDSSINIDTSSTPGKMDITVTTPADNKVKVNASDSTAKYLEDKLFGTQGSWGLAVNVTPTIDNSQLGFTAVVADSTALISNFLDTVTTSPALLAKLKAAIEATESASCAAINDLIVTLDGVDFELNWTPAAGSTTSQIAKYRAKNTVTWLTGNFSPANILTDTDATTTTNGLNTNTVYEFQVDSICPGGVGNSNIFESVVFATQVLTTPVVSQQISVDQNPLPNSDVVQYRLKNNADVVLQTASVSSSSPFHTFTAVGAGTYKVDWRYGATVNGVTLYSDDATQANAWYQKTGIVVT